MKATNYACFKLEEKATRSVKKNENSFEVTEDQVTLNPFHGTGFFLCFLKTSIILSRNKACEFHILQGSK